VFPPSPKKPMEALNKSILDFSAPAIGKAWFSDGSQKTRLPTVLVLVADHTAHVQGSMFYQYAIPFALYAPGLLTPRNLDWAASQRDIAPTLIDLLGLPYDGLAGESLLHPRRQHVAEYQHAGRLGWFEGSRLVDFSVVSGADMRSHDRRKPSCACGARPAETRNKSGNGLVRHPDKIRGT